MEKIKQKSKKDKFTKNADKEKSAMFISDIKSLKENIKIREILRTVKMSSSMRLKAPRGSKVMQNKDFNDNEEFDETESNEYDEAFESPSALNPAVVLKNSHIDLKEVPGTPDTIDEENHNDESKDGEEIESNNLEDASTPTDDFTILHKSNSVSDVLHTDPEEQSVFVPNTPQTPLLTPNLKDRRRKLSLDQTILSRGESLSQSNIDLHSIGKSPLERKSSFFRKKMDSFFKNTTEIFKRQSFQSKSQNISRRGSMSVSLQSLNEKTSCNGEIPEQSEADDLKAQGSATSLQSSSTAEHASSLSVDAQVEVDRAGSSPALAVSRPLGDASSHSVNSLTETMIHDAILNRAISMSTGLDSAQMDRRKASRSNRFTWVASEGITNYFRRQSQREKSREMQVCHSYQDFSTIPENTRCGNTTEYKGRRLSYQRAVSGEDPITLSRYNDASLRRKPLIPENPEADVRLVRLLAEYEAEGVPPLQGLVLYELDDQSATFLAWTEVPSNLIHYYEAQPGGLSRMEEVRQAMIRELVVTEADYIRSLKCILDLFIAAAHALQKNGFLLEIETEKIFYNIPDIINANLYFWETTLVPMLQDATKNKTPFNPELMLPGFLNFRTNFTSYETYLKTQKKALDYVKSSCSNSDFSEYLAWCHANKNCNRLQLADFLSKPMQRLTKYPLIVRRIVENTESDTQRAKLARIEYISTEHMQYLNRLIRQRDELDAVDELSANLEPYEIDFKDEDMERAFRSLSQVNLKLPMVNCLPGHKRMLIFQGDLRFRDTGKEHDVRAFLLTDMLLICKRNTKVPTTFKLLRPKFMIDKLVAFPKQHNRANRDFLSLVYVVLDEVGTAHTAFALSEPGKDGNGHQVTLKMWDQKIREAKKTYDMAVFYAKYPFQDLSEKDSTSEAMKFSEEDTADRDAMERMATMIHGTMGTSSEYEYSTSMVTDTAAGAEAAGAARSRTPTLQGLRKQMARGSTGDSSRISSLQQSLSASGDEPQPSLTRQVSKGTEVAITSTVLPIMPSEDGVTSITVNIVSEPDGEVVDNADSQTVETLQLSPTTQRCASPQRSPSPQRTSSPQLSLTPTPQRPPMLQRSRTPQPPKLVMQQKILPARSASAGHTLQVEPQSGTPGSVHSLPDIGVEPPALPPQPQPTTDILQSSTLTASEKLYHYHREQMEKRLLAVTQPQYLSPDNRGISYPPLSPTRASLKRGLAFSHSLKNPPLCKMGHVQSQQQPDAGTVTTSTNVNEAPMESQPSKPDKKMINSAMNKEKNHSKHTQKCNPIDKEIIDHQNPALDTEKEKEWLQEEVKRKQENHESIETPENYSEKYIEDESEPADMEQGTKKEHKKEQNTDKRNGSSEQREGDKDQDQDRQGDDINKEASGGDKGDGDKDKDDKNKKDKKGEKDKKDKKDEKDEKEKKKIQKEDEETKDKGKGRGKKSIKLKDKSKEQQTQHAASEKRQKTESKDDVEKSKSQPAEPPKPLEIHRKLQRTPVTDKYELISRAKIEALSRAKREEENKIEQADEIEPVSVPGPSVRAPIIIDSSTSSTSSLERNRTG